MTFDRFLKLTVHGPAFLLVCLAAASPALAEENKDKKVEGQSGEMEAGKGWLSVTTNPWVEVEVDGQKIGNTPLVDRPMKAGKYSLTLINTDQGINITIVVVIINGQHIKIVKDLQDTPKPTEGTLSVASTPPTTVVVDGKEIGLTPQTKIKLKPGSHEVSLISEEFDIKYSCTVDIKAGKKTKLVKSFEAKEKKGMLSITTNPWTTVFLEGTSIGNTPVTKYYLEPGNYKISLVNEDLKINFSTTVTITKGKETKLVKSFKAAAEQGSLTVISKPVTTVFVDGKKAGSTPLFDYSLSPGTHEVRLVNYDVGVSDTFSVSIDKGKNVTIKKDYEEKPGPYKIVD